MLSGAWVHEVDRGEIPPRHAKPKRDEGAIRGRDFEANALDSDGAIAPSLGARDLGAKGASKGIGAGSLAAYGGSAQVARQRRLLDLGVLLAVVLLLSPGPVLPC